MKSQAVCLLMHPMEQAGLIFTKCSRKVKEHRPQNTGQTPLKGPSQESHFGVHPWEASFRFAETEDWEGCRAGLDIGIRAPVAGEQLESQRVGAGCDKWKLSTCHLKFFLYSTGT